MSKNRTLRSFRGLRLAAKRKGFSISLRSLNTKATLITLSFCVLLCDGTGLISIDLGFGEMIMFSVFEPKGQFVRKFIEKLSKLRFSGEETLFVVDDVIADETLDKTSEPVVGACNFGTSSKA